MEKEASKKKYTVKPTYIGTVTLGLNGKTIVTNDLPQAELEYLYEIMKFPGIVKE